MEFKKKLNIRRNLGICFILVGLALIVFSAWNHFENHFFSGYGGGLIAIGTMRLIQYRRITRSEKSMRSRELEESDERLRMLSERARSWTFSATLIVAGVVVILLSVMGKHDLAQPFAWYVCGMVLLYWIFWMILSRKY